jgi:L-fucose isomerase
MAETIRLDEQTELSSVPVTFGVFATCDPRIDEESRQRARNIVAMVADVISENVKMPDGESVRVVWTPVLVDGERQADIVAQQFRQAGVGALVCAPDTWAFPQLSLVSLLQQFPGDTPLNLTCGNSGPKPGVVFTHAASGAISQYGRLVHINVGTWPDTGLNPQMTESTAAALVDWAYAALTAQALKGRRVVIWGHDSMGMETALAHVIPTRNAFGIEIARLDMKLLADMLRKQAYDAGELQALRAWVDDHVGDRLEIRDDHDNTRFDQSLAMYLITRDVMADLNAVGGGFMSQLEWGSDPRGIPLPVADAMESLFNSTFDHEGRKPPLPYATEADVQGLLTMLFSTYLSGGNPPLFMDFRKVWEPWEINALAKELKIPGLDGSALWEQKGLVDGDNSGSASFDWAALPGASVEEIMAGVSMPLADPGYFPGLGNSVTFVTPGGIEGIAARLAYSAVNGMFSLVWDEATTVELPEQLSEAVCQTSTATWPHTFVVPKYATMVEYKQYAPANHFHMTWQLNPARVQYWMDLTNVLSVTPWVNRPSFVEGVDRPAPLLHLINGGEVQAKTLLASR